MDLVLKYRSEIYGVLALWIVFFHIEGGVGCPIYIPLLSSFIQRGNCAVDIFLFLSGFCLCLSLKKSFRIKRFYINRFKRVIISYLIISIPFFIWKCMEENPTAGLSGFFYDLTGLSFWLSGCLNAWFVHAIIFFYIITPLLFIIVSKGFGPTLISIFFLYGIVLFSHWYLPSFNNIGIALTRLPIFYMGIILAFYKPHFEFKEKRAWVICFITYGLIFFMTVPSYYKGFVIWVLYATIVVPIIWILSSIFNKLPYSINSALSSLGKISLEIYICHIMIWHIIRFYEFEKLYSYWMFFLLPSLSIPLSFLISYISKKLTKYIK